jgi:hypothetical protein
MPFAWIYSWKDEHREGLIYNGEGVRGERGGAEEEGQTLWNPVMELPLYPAVYLNEIKSQAQH